MCVSLSPVPSSPAWATQCALLREGYWPLAMPKATVWHLDCRENHPTILQLSFNLIFILWTCITCSEQRLCCLKKNVVAHNGVQLFRFIPELCVLTVTVRICNTLMFRTWVQVQTFVYHKCQHASGFQRVT